MCLSFDYSGVVHDWHHVAATKQAAAAEAAAAGEAALKAAHDDVDCSGIQVTILNHLDGSRSLLFYMPLSSPTAVLAMYPCKRDCIGDDAEYLVPCDSIPCNASNLDAWYQPGKYVPIPDDVDDMPVYRSLCVGGAATVPVIELPPSKCIKNLNGSCTFVLKTADYVKSDAEIQEAIETGMYADKVAYLLTLGDACFKSLVDSMTTNGVDKSKVFAMTEVDEVDPGAKINFLNEFYPNMRANHDMLVSIPGPDKDGNLKMEAAFSFCFHYPEARRYHPMLGLVHNVDHSTVSTEQAVEGDYYVISNASLPMTIDNPETGVPTNVRLCDSGDFLPVVPVHRSLSANPNLDQPKDYDAWITGCESLQTKVEVAYWASISKVCNNMGLPAFAQENFYSTNLVGSFLAKGATSVVCGKDSRMYDGGSVLGRMKAARKA